MNHRMLGAVMKMDWRHDYNLLSCLPRHPLVSLTSLLCPSCPLCPPHLLRLLRPPCLLHRPHLPRPPHLLRPSHPLCLPHPLHSQRPPCPPHHVDCIHHVRCTHCVHHVRNIHEGKVGKAMWKGNWWCRCCQEAVTALVGMRTSTRVVFVFWTAMCKGIDPSASLQRKVGSTLKSRMVLVVDVSWSASTSQPTLETAPAWSEQHDIRLNDSILYHIKCLLECLCHKLVHQLLWKGHRWELP